MNGICVKSCPDGYFAAAADENGRQMQCTKCHYTCRRCEGSNDNDCIECYSDAHIHRNGHCHAKELVQEVIELEKWYTAVTVIFLCLCLVILVLVIYIVTDKNPQLLLFCCSVKSSRHQTLSYNGLPLRNGGGGQKSTSSTVLRLQSNEKATYQDEPSEDDL